MKRDRCREGGEGGVVCHVPPAGFSLEERLAVGREGLTPSGEGSCLSALAGGALPAPRGRVGRRRLRPGGRRGRRTPWLRGCEFYVRQADGGQGFAWGELVNAASGLRAPGRLPALPFGSVRSFPTLGRSPVWTPASAASLRSRHASRPDC